MPEFATDEQLYATLRALFARIEEHDPQAARTLLNSRLRIRLRFSQPTAELLIDASQRPFHVAYGPCDARPDLDVSLTADTLHQILLGRLSLAKALGNKSLQPNGPVWKVMALAGLFRQAQAVYPDVLQGQNRA